MLLNRIARLSLSAALLATALPGLPILAAPSAKPAKPGKTPDVLREERAARREKALACANDDKQDAGKKAATFLDYGRWCLKNGWPVEGDGWLMRAYPLKPGADLLKELAQSAAASDKAGDVLEAGRCLDFALAQAAPDLKPALQKSLDGLGERLAKARKDRDAFIETAKASWAERTPERHTLHYGILLPTDFDPAKSWPLVVDVTGSAGNWDDAVQAWSSQRSRGYVFVCPATVSNTNENGGTFKTMKPLPYEEKFLAPMVGNKTAQLNWEADGIEAIVEQLSRDLNVDPTQVVLTGLSGGGNHAYFSIFHRRWNYRAIAPRNPNYYAQNMDLGTAPNDKKPVAFPVHIFMAGDDEYGDSLSGGPGVKGQTKNAQSELKLRNFTKVQETTVPGVKHNQSSQYYDQILDWFDGILGKPKPTP